MGKKRTVFLACLSYFWLSGPKVMPRQRKPDLQEHAIIYVFKIVEMSVENNNKKNVQMSLLAPAGGLRRQLAFPLE